MPATRRERVRAETLDQITGAARDQLREVGAAHVSLRGVAAALGMRAALAEFNRSGDQPPVHAGIGIHSGPLIAGNVGTEQRTEYTVLGDTVNVAARIEGATKDQGTDILVSDVVVALLRPEEWAEVHFASRGPILLKGKSVPLNLLSLSKEL